MRKYIFLIPALFLMVHVVNAQQGDEALTGDYPLNERYQLLKSKTQNYKDYKVIRENVLDAFWKIVRDSVAAKEAAIKSREQNIQKLNNELSQTQIALKEKEESMEAIVYDSTHISVLGIPFTKGIFLTIVAIIFAALILGVLLMTGRLKLVHHAMKERNDAFNSLSSEFEEYKRKAMEKQTKLSRELQNERNRLSESRGM